MKAPIAKITITTIISAIVKPLRPILIDCQDKKERKYLQL